MFLLFSQQEGTREWFFTGTFKTREEAVAYTKEYFSGGTYWTICEQDKVTLAPSWRERTN